MQDFLTIGSLRNQLVHGNYAAFALEKTSAEIFGLYESALYFVDLLPWMLRVDIDREDDGTS